MRKKEIKIMLVLGFCKLTSKKGLPMAKVQCVRDYTSEEVARLDGVGGSCVDDIWIYNPLLDKVTPACISKEMLITAAWQNGRMSITDIIYTTNAIENLNSTYRKLNRQRSVFPSDTALLKAMYLATFEATKKWTMRH